MTGRKVGVKIENEGHRYRGSEKGEREPREFKGTPLKHCKYNRSGLRKAADGGGRGEGARQE